jgi:UPF0755 protein
MTRTRILIAVGVLLLVAVAAAAYVIFLAPNTSGDAAGHTVFVRRGEAFSRIADSLEARGIIRSRTTFMIVARVLGGAERVQAGKYTFASGISNMDLFLTLRDGSANQLIKVSIPEGARPRLQAKIFARAIGIDSARYVNIAYDPEVARDYEIEGASLEGYLLPETYSLRWGMDERELIAMQLHEFNRFFSDSLKERARELGWSVHQAVTFASIVEGEAVLNEERPVIAGVYHNRLRMGMKLEADPTIQYLFDERPRRVLYADLRRDSPYNTYLYTGLPPGPVNDPGKASMLASLYPASHPYIFFVATGKGGHWFASSYTQHMMNVRRYRHERARQWREQKGPT